MSSGLMSGLFANNYYWCVCVYVCLLVVATKCNQQERESICKPIDATAATAGQVSATTVKLLLKKIHNRKTSGSNFLKVIC